MHSFIFMRLETSQGKPLQSSYPAEGRTDAATSNHVMGVASHFGVAEADAEVVEITSYAGYASSRTVTGFAPPAGELQELAQARFPNLGNNMYLVGKRLFDIVFASAAITLSSPLLLIIAIAIKVSSAGPVFFRQERVGKNGKIFYMLKFRTMLVAEKSFTDTSWRAADDPRRTAVGTLLRRTSLDELPQFFNVLWGQMSVVGPRPERPFFVDKFALDIPRYELRHCGHVGITGLAQIHGFRGDTCIETRVSYDLEYLESWSLKLDFKIVWLTIKGIFLSEHE